MRTFSLLKELPVYEVSSGKKLGEVLDLSITGNGKIEGLLIKTGALFKKTFLIRVSDVSSFGMDGIMVEDRKALTPLQGQPEYTFEHHRGLTGKVIMSSEGEKLGLLSDVYFTEEVGTIVGYELTDGFFSDITEGKKVVKTIEPPTFGKDAIIVNVNPV